MASHENLSLSPLLNFDFIDPLMGELSSFFLDVEKYIAPSATLNQTQDAVVEKRRKGRPPKYLNETALEKEQRLSHQNRKDAKAFREREKAKELELKKELDMLINKCRRDPVAWKEYQSLRLEEIPEYLKIRPGRRPKGVKTNTMLSAEAKKKRQQQQNVQAASRRRERKKIERRNMTKQLEFLRNEISCQEVKEEEAKNAKRLMVAVIVSLKNEEEAKIPIV
jgi:hypothetical protein